MLRAYTRCGTMLAIGPSVSYLFLTIFFYPIATVLKYDLKIVHQIRFTIKRGRRHGLLESGLSSRLRSSAETCYYIR